MVETVSGRPAGELTGSPAPGADGTGGRTPAPERASRAVPVRGDALGPGVPARGGATGRTTTARCVGDRER